MKSDSLKRRFQLVINQYENNPVIQEQKRIASLSDNEVESEFEKFVLDICNEHNIKTYDQFKEAVNRKSLVKSLGFAYPDEVRNNIDLVKEDIEKIISNNA